MRKIVRADIEISEDSVVLVQVQQREPRKSKKKLVET